MCTKPKIISGVTLGNDNGLPKNLIQGSAQSSERFLSNPQQKASMNLVSGFDTMVILIWLEKKQLRLDEPISTERLEFGGYVLIIGVK